MHAEAAMRYVWILALLAMMVGCDDGGAVGLPIDFDGGTDATLADADVPADADADADEEEEDCFNVWPDADGDGFGAKGSDPIEVCDGVIPEGHVANHSDCYDENPDVFPGQTEFFHRDRGDGSFDYDCDGVEELERTDMVNSPVICDNGVPLGGMPGWRATCTSPDGHYCNHELFPPGCGEKAAWYENCGAGGKVIYQRCR